MRAWRILNVDDEFPKMLESINHHLYDPMKFLQQQGLLPFEWNDGEWSGSIPLKYRNVSAAWRSIKGLSQKGAPPDICFLDIKLTTHKERDTEIELEKIKLEILSFIAPELVGWFEDDIGRAFRDDPDLVIEKRRIWKRGGFYIMGLIRRLFQQVEIIVYSEAHEAIEESVPYQIGNMYSFHPRGKTLVPSSESDDRITWLYYFDKVLRKKLLTGKVSLPKIKEAILSLRQSLTGLGATTEADYHDVDDNEKKRLKEALLHFVRHDIGGAEKEWKVGTFFSFAFLSMFEYKDIFIFHALQNAMRTIENYIDSVEFTPSFARFVSEPGGYFDVISHVSDNKLLANKYCIGNPADMMNSLIKIVESGKQNALMEAMLNLWQQLPCYRTHLTESFTELLNDINTDISYCLEEKHFNSLKKYFYPAERAKNVLRLRIIDNEKLIKDVIAIARKYRNISEDRIFSSYGGDRLNSAYDFKLTLAAPEISIVLPAKTYDQDAQNILGDLMVATLCCIHEKGFKLTPDLPVPENMSIDINVGIDFSTFEYVLTITQKGGDSIPAEILTDSFIFMTENGFRSELAKVKGWIKIRIESEGISRDPHIHEDSAWQLCELPIDVTTRYEFRVALVPDFKDNL